MDYNLLYNEISRPQYAGMIDAEIVTALNTLSEPTRQRVTVKRLQEVAYQSGVDTALNAVVLDTSKPTTLRALCQTVQGIVNSRLDDVNLDDPSAQQMFGALQTYGVINPTQAAAINVLSVVPGTSRAQDIGLDDVTEDDITAARNWYEYGSLEARLQAGSAIALGWLRQQRDAGAVVPEWTAVLERM